MISNIKPIKNTYYYNKNQHLPQPEGADNNLLQLIAEAKRFPMTLEELEKAMDPSRYVGRAPYQVTKYLDEVVNPVLEANKDVIGMKAEINV